MRHWARQSKETRGVGGTKGSGEVTTWCEGEAVLLELQHRFLRGCGGAADAGWTQHAISAAKRQGLGGDTGHDATFYAEGEVPGNGANHQLQRLCTKAAAAGSGGVAGAVARERNESS